MTKAELVNIIAEKTGVSRVDVIVTLEQFFKEIVESVSEGDNVYIRGFGSFVAKKRAAKKARDMAKGTTIIIPEKYVPFFKPSRGFCDIVKEEMERKMAPKKRRAKSKKRKKH